MAEVIVHDKKPIFMSTKGFTILLIVLLGLSATTAEDSNGPSLFNLESSELLPHQISKKSDVLEGSEKKFSTILSLTSPFAKSYRTSPALDQETASSHNAPQVFKTSSSSILTGSGNAIQSDTQTPKTSLWNVVKNSFFQPQISRDSSIFPQLKTPKEAWDDFISNAKTGFKQSHSPFQSASTTSTPPPTTTQRTPSVLELLKPKNSEPTNAGDKSDSDSVNNRDVRGIFRSSTQTLAVNTAKIMSGIGQNLLTNYIQNGISSGSLLKGMGYSPWSEKLRFNQGIAQIYQGKLRDLALLNFLHKDKKVSAIQNIFGDGGWSFREPEKVAALVPAQPVTSGWASVPTVVQTVAPSSLVSHHVVAATPIVGQLISAKINLHKQLLSAKISIGKQLLAAKFGVLAELIRTIPTTLEIKGNLLRAVLHVLTQKDKSSFIKALKILNKAVWQGKRRFLQVLLRLTEHKGYGPPVISYGPPSTPPPYGPPSTPPPYGPPSTPPSYGPPSTPPAWKSYLHPTAPPAWKSYLHPTAPPAWKSYGVPKDPLPSYGTPPASSYGTPPASSYGTPPASSYGTPPASSYGTPPASSYGTPPISSYGTPPISSYGNHPAPSSHETHSGSSYGKPPVSSYGSPSYASVVSEQIKNPLYSYPKKTDNSYPSTDSTYDYSSQPQNYDTLPPVFIPPVRSGRDGQSKSIEYHSKTQPSQEDSSNPQQSTSTLLESFGSDIPPQPPTRETFLTRFIKANDPSNTSKRSPDSSPFSFKSPAVEESPKVEDTKLPKFSATLLGTGFARN